MPFSPLPNLEEVFVFQKRTGQPRRWPVHVDFFAEPLSVDAAYWLGFIYADGSVSWKRPTGKGAWVLTICLKPSDAFHLRLLQEKLGGRVRVGKAARLDVYSKLLCERLAELGVVPRKSWSPVCPPSLFGDSRIAFLRGMFDGDGCLHVNKRGYIQAAFCGHPDLVEWFVEQVGVIGSSMRRDNTLYYQWTGGRQARAIIRVLYGHEGPSLKRKQMIADRFL